MDFTVHYINVVWEIQSSCLQFLYFSESHAGENLSEGLCETLKSCGLEEPQQICITAGNGSNILSAVSMLNWTHLSCLRNNLNSPFSIRLKYAVHFLASCMALLGCLKLTAKVCFP